MRERNRKRESMNQMREEEEEDMFNIQGFEIST